MNNHTNGTVGDKYSKTARRTFSVSKEFAHLLTEIDNLPNSSRFICEAIAEKLERQKNPGKDIADALANFVQLQSIFANPQTQAIQNMNYAPQPDVSTAPSNTGAVPGVSDGDTYTTPSPHTGNTDATDVTNSPADATDGMASTDEDNASGVTNSSGNADATDVTDSPADATDEIASTDEDNSSDITDSSGDANATDITDSPADATDEIASTDEDNSSDVIDSTNEDNSSDVTNSTNEDNSVEEVSDEEKNNILKSFGANFNF